MRVRELHETASSCKSCTLSQAIISETSNIISGVLAFTTRTGQDEISSFTQLSLRGGKRRGTPTKGCSEEAETEDSERVEVEKLTDLCRHPVLDKVGRLVLAFLRCQLTQMG